MTMQRVIRARSGWVLGLMLAGLAPCTVATAQSSAPAVFVSNNGNLEGSVTAFRLNTDGTLTFVNRVITGSRAAIADACPGCNAYEISLSPDGRHLAVAHAAGDFDSVTIHRVNADASISLLGAFPMPTPIDVVWLSNNLLAVAQPDFSPDRITLYRFNGAVNTLTQTDSINAGTGTSYLAAHPSGQYLFANDSGTARSVLLFNIFPSGVIASGGSEPTGAPFALEIALTPGARRLYGAGGISNGSNKIVGMNVAENGTLAIMPGSPFVSPGVSPSNVASSLDGEFLFVGHGTDATVRVLKISSNDGSLTDTGFLFDVGDQGSLGDVASGASRMFVTDNSTAFDGRAGIYSFAVSPDGALTQNGPINPTQGIAPRSVAVWTPPFNCAADANSDNRTDGNDLSILLANFGNSGSGPSFGDFNGDGIADGADLSVLLANFGCGT